MKILCPEHNGLIEVPSKDIADALRTPSKVLIHNCLICQQEVLIKNIRLEHEITLDNVKGNRSRNESSKKNKQVQTTI